MVSAPVRYLERRGSAFGVLQPVIFVKRFSINMDLIGHT